MRVAFQTYSTDGPIARFMASDGSFYEVYMVSEWALGLGLGLACIPNAYRCESPTPPPRTLVDAILRSVSRAHAHAHTRVHRHPGRLR